MPVTQETFAALVLEDTDGRWEIYRRRLREKPEMSFGHNRTARALARQLLDHLSADEFDVLQNSGHLLVPTGDSYVPDVAIVPLALYVRFQNDPTRFERYEEPLPLVVEVWSPSTGQYDVDTKIPGYRLRGDLEIWRVHPFDRTLTTWRRMPSGDYVETTLRAGTLSLHAVPNVDLDLERLFAD